MRDKVDLTGNRFGNLTVIREAPEHVTKSGNRKRRWVCKCDCGNECEVSMSNLNQGRTKSCGCLKRRTQGGFDNGKRTRLYIIWQCMKARCNNKNNKKYHNYGGRGIRVCKEWQTSFTSFMKWAKENGYKDNLSIDRIDVNGNYCPENCRWSDYETQQNNRRDCVFIEYGGVIKTMMQWSRDLGVKYDTLRKRRDLGWSDEMIIGKPVKKYNYIHRS